MEKSEIAKKIMIDEDSIFTRLVEKASSVFKLDKKGNIVWMFPQDKLNDKEKISIVLLAQHLAAKIDLVENPTISNSAIAEKLGVSSMSVGARIAELRDQGVAQQEKVGSHQVIIHGVEKILEKIISRIQN
ncbi:MAG: winged helix-turn-helix transcriptional regulator [Anaerolineales bacterium]|nr:winged helix-turn-helix transcriptional regulator [Anaerolineales bacterium]